jgi:L-alanine-DL-glutamate epimerase-like enolase superfamily enzyme
MALTLSHEVLELETAHPFGIARGTQSAYRVVWVRITDGDGDEGWGEASPSSFYGETADTVVVALARLAPVIADCDPFDLEGIDARLFANLKHNAAAKAAISGALHDLVGKKLGVPVWKMWGLDPAKAPLSSFTIGIDSPAVIKRKIKEAEQYPILKIKVGTADDEAILEAVRDATDKPVRVDANCGWTAKQAIRNLPMLEEFGVELIEQPLPPDDLEGLGLVRSASSMPIIADESCRTAADIPKLVGLVDGINIKLAKCGSLREAVRMIAVARAHHMSVMVGCMIETSIGISAAAQFTPLLDIVDLDGAALLKQDPFSGASIANGKVSLPTAPGLGLSRRSVER